MLSDFSPGPDCRAFYNSQLAVLHGDACRVLQTLPDNSVSLIFLDPPYNIGKKFAGFVDKWPSDEAYIQWCQQWLEQCLRVLKKDGTLFFMTSTQAMPYLDIWLRDRLTVLSRIAWHYDSSGVQAKHHFGSMYEPILHCVANAKKYTFNAGDILVEAKTGARRKLIDYRKAVPTAYSSKKVPGNAWYFPRVRYRMSEYENHPTQKPKALLERIVLASSNPGDIVLDPFSGTFTTGEVAANLGRKFIGIERELDYVKIGLRRLNLATTLDGQTLQSVTKTFKRKNKKHPTTTWQQQELPQTAAPES